MSINSLIANPQPPGAIVQMNDPLVQYGKVLQDGYLQSEIGKAKQASTQLTAEQNAFLAPGAYDSKGNLNRGVVVNALASGGAGNTIPGYQSGWAKSDLDAATAGKDNAQAGSFNAQAGNFNAEAIGKTMANYQSRLGGISSDPKLGPLQYLAQVKGMLADPTIGPLLARQGETGAADTADVQQAVAAGQWSNFLQSKQLTAAQALQAHENIVTAAKNGEGTSVFSTNKFGAPTSNLVGKTSLNGVMPQRPVTNINNNIAVDAAAKGTDEYAKSFLGGLGKEDLGLYTASRNAPQGIARLDSLSNLIHKGTVLSGMAGPAKLQLARAAQAAGLLPPGDPSVVDTQVFAKLATQQLLQQMRDLKAAGVSMARFSIPMLQMMQAGNPNLSNDPQANLAIAGALRQTYTDAQGQWNNRVQELDNNPNSKLAPSMGAGVIHTLPVTPPYQAPVGVDPAVQALLRKHGLPTK